VYTRYRSLASIHLQPTRLAAALAGPVPLGGIGGLRGHKEACSLGAKQPSASGAAARGAPNGTVLCTVMCTPGGKGS
jgi:hypothetical protein